MPCQILLKVDDCIIFHFIKIEVLIRFAVKAKCLDHSASDCAHFLSKYSWTKGSHLHITLARFGHPVSPE